MALIISLDGCSPEYLEKSNIPIMRSLQTEGTYAVGGAMVPTVTNVNNVSMVTGEYPVIHGITSNCYYDRKEAREVYMESARSIRAKTVFEKLHGDRARTALLSVKKKLCTLLNRGVDIVFSAENPPEWVVNEMGAPPSIYSTEVNVWLLKALRLVQLRYSPQFTYVATTDYVEHKYAPEETEAKRHLELIDDELGELIDRLPRMLLCLVADHGMNLKRRAVNLRSLLAEAGIESVVIPTVKDRYVPHHSNLSGSAYVYLANRRQRRDALDMLVDFEGVEHVHTTDDAQARYHLPRRPIGDFFVLAEKDAVFGEVEQSVSDVTIRSHGSLHEQKIPTIVHGSETRRKVSENKDLFNVVLDELKQNWC